MRRYILAGLIVAGFVSLLAQAQPPQAGCYPITWGTSTLYTDSSAGAVEKTTLLLDGGFIDLVSSCSYVEVGVPLPDGGATGTDGGQITACWFAKGI